jgi:hypothetical protein
VSSEPSERVAALDALDMIWDAREEDWQRWLAAARVYREAHGDLRVLQSFVTENGLALGQWINRQRTERKRDKLLHERVAALDSLDMVW